MQQSREKVNVARFQVPKCNNGKEEVIIMAHHGIIIVKECRRIKKSPRTTVIKLGQPDKPFWVRNSTASTNYIIGY
jgi:hypothetical protein